MKFARSLLVVMGCHSAADSIEERTKRISALGDAPGDLATLIAIASDGYEWPGSLSSSDERETRCDAMKQIVYLGGSRPTSPPESIDRLYASALDVYPTNSRVAGLLESKDSCIVEGARILVDIVPFPSLRNHFEQHRAFGGLKAIDRREHARPDPLGDFVAFGDEAAFRSLIVAYRGVDPDLRDKEVPFLVESLAWLSRRVASQPRRPQLESLASSIRSGALGAELVATLENENDARVRASVWDVFRTIARPQDAVRLRALAARESDPLVKDAAEAALAAFESRRN